MTLPIEILHPGPHALGEGPMWHDGHLWWIDILAPALFRMDLDGSDLRRWDMPSPIGCVVAERSGCLLVGLEDGVHAFDPTSGKLLLRAPLLAAGHRLNDGKVGPDGEFLVGGMAYDNTPGASALFHLVGDRLVPRVDAVSCSNGLAWSSGGSTLYYIDTGTRRLDAFAYAAGVVTQRRSVHAFTEGWPDGMTIDQDGGLWVALWDGACVVRIDPTDGRETTRIPLPARRPTCCTFAGPACDLLVITTARTGLTDPTAADGAILAVRPGRTGYPTRLAAR